MTMSKMIPVLFTFDAQFCGVIESKAYIPEDATEQEIKDKFRETIGVEFDDNCSYEILDK